MSALFIIALVLFLVGAILCFVPAGQLSKAGLALVFIALFLAVFLPGLHVS